MKFYTGILIALFALNGHAKDNHYKLVMELSLNGKAVSSPQMVVEEGKMGSISQTTGGSADELVIEVVAKDIKRNAVQLSFNVAHMVNGKRESLGSPRLITNLGEAASISATDENGSGYSLSVLPTLAE